MGANRKAELEAAFEKLRSTTTSGEVIGTSERVLIACTLAIGATVLQLDDDINSLNKTSTLLSKVNIGIAVIVLLVGIMQFIFMVRGH